MTPQSNRILSALPPNDRALLEPLELTPMKRRHIVYDLNKPIEAVVFPHDTLISIVSILSNGTAIETCTIGNEGMAGLPLFLGAGSSATQAFVQVSGSGYRVPAARFKAAVDESRILRDTLSRYTSAVLTMIAQTSACNRKHPMEQRCARWLLMTHDRVGREQFELTHQFLSQMLGVRRASVTVAAGMLQKAGIITYQHGVVTILDRRSLQATACECYAIIQNEFARLVGGPSLPDPLARVSASEKGMTVIGDGAGDDAAAYATGTER